MAAYAILSVVHPLPACTYSRSLACSTELETGAGASAAAGGQAASAQISKLRVSPGDANLGLHDLSAGVLDALRQLPRLLLADVDCRLGLQWQTSLRIWQLLQSSVPTHSYGATQQWPGPGCTAPPICRVIMCRECAPEQRRDVFVGNTLHSSFGTYLGQQRQDGGARVAAHHRHRHLLGVRARDLPDERLRPHHIQLCHAQHLLWVVRACVT